MGQSNIAAGATIGSNHNSRGADGEIIMGRGFWPGLCVSLKHNSRFASFCIVTKGDYPAELDIPIPFSLVHHDVVNDRITILPGYWFLYNMYALARNAAKYQDRDQRTEKTQLLEFDYLAPDTAPELLQALQLIETATGKALLEADPSLPTTIEPRAFGKQALLSNNEKIQSLTIHLEGVENSKRKVVLLKVLPAYQIFCEMLLWYGIRALINLLKEKECKNIVQLKKAIPSKLTIEPFINVGGQLIKQQALDSLLQKIKSGKVKSWNTIHDFYEQQGNVYANQKQINALAVLETLTGIRLTNITGKEFNQLLTQAEQIQGSINNRIRQSRMKDYENEFRKMVYANEAEMKAVLGDPEQNAFLLQQQKETVQLKKTIQQIRKQFVLQPPKK
jgi:hypothetical protein